VQKSLSSVETTATNGRRYASGFVFWLKQLLCVFAPLRDLFKINHDQSNFALFALGALCVRFFSHLRSSFTVHGFCD